MILLFNTELTSMWAFGDLNAYPLDPNTVINWIIYSWKDEGLGFPNNPVFNYYSLVFATSSLLGSILAQKVLFISTMIISFVSFYFFERHFGFRRLNSFVGALLYSFNPVVVASFVGGSIGELMTFAVFPFVMIIIHRLITNDKFKIRYVAILAIMGLFLWNTYVTIWMSLIILIPFVGWLIVEKGLRRTLRLLPAVVAVLIVLSPNLVSLFLISYSSSDNTGSYASAVRYTYKDMNLANMIRLAGNTGSAQSNEFLGYNELNFYTVFGFVLSAFLIIALIHLVKNFKSLYRNNVLFFSMTISLVTALSLLLILGSNPDLADLSIIFATLRNPAKLMYPLVFSFAVLFSFGFQHASLNTDRVKHMKVILPLAMIFAIIFYNFPALDGTLGIQKIRANQYFVENKYYEMAKVLNSEDSSSETGRVLFLPWEYPTYLRIRTEIQNYYGMSPVSQRSISADGDSYDIFESIKRNDVNKAELLGALNIRYIVIDKNYNGYYEGQAWYDSLRTSNSIFTFSSLGSRWISGEPSAFLNIFETDSNFQSIYDTESFAIYNNTQFQEKITWSKANETDASGLTYSSSGPNLLNNPSFDDGLTSWAAWPQSLVNVHSTSENPDNSIVLRGQKEWFTNIYQNVPITGDKLYLLDFKFIAQNSTDLHAKILWTNQTSPITDIRYLRTDYIKLGEMDLDNGSENRVQQVFLAPSEANEARVQFLAGRNEVYDSTVFIIKDIAFYPVRSELSGIENITFSKPHQKVDPTHYKMDLDIQGPFNLQFTESYDPSWIATLTTDNEVTTHKPVRSNFPVNNFIINSTAIYKDIEIQYAPQTKYFPMLVISIMALILSASYLGFEGVRSRFKNIQFYAHRNVRESLIPLRITRTSDLKHSIEPSLVGIGNLAAGFIGGIFWLAFALITQVSDYGEANYYISLVSILSVMSIVGLNLAVMTFLPKGDERFRRQAGMIVVITNLIIAIPLIAITRSLPLALMLFGTSFFGMTIAEALGNKQYRKFPVLVIGQRAAQFVLAIALYFVLGIDGIIAGYGISALAFSYSFIKGQKHSLMSLFATSRTAWRESLDKSLDSKISAGLKTTMVIVRDLKPKLAFITHAYSVTIAQSLTLYADKLFIAPVFGFATLGLYQLGFQFLMFLGVIPASLIHYLLPQESSGANRAIVRKLGLAISVIIAAILFFTLGWIIGWLFPTYADAISAARIMILGIIPMTANALFNSRSLGREDGRPVIIGAGIYLGALFLLLYVLGTLFGINGLAAGVVASLSIQSVALLFMTRRSNTTNLTQQMTKK